MFPLGYPHAKSISIKSINDDDDNDKTIDTSEFPERVGEKATRTDVVVLVRLTEI